MTSKCWGLGAAAVGDWAYSSVRCAGCNQRRKYMLWFGLPGHQLAYCQRCAVARHVGCPCLS